MRLNTEKPLFFCACSPDENYKHVSKLRKMNERIYIMKKSIQ